MTVSTDAWRAAHEGAARFALPGNGVVRFAGPDALRFTNGMFTNNLRDLAIGSGNRNAMTDAKGRMLGLFTAYRIAAEELLLVLDGVDPEAFVARYDRYIVFDDVTLHDDTGASALLTVQGPEAAAVLARAGLPVPEDRVAHAGDVLVLARDRAGRGGFDVLVRGPEAAERAAEVAADLDGAGAVPTGSNADDADTLEVLRVEAGKPRWPVDMGDKEMVHAMGLRDEVCHFAKGCYIGQEVINRLDVMGRLRKRLTGVQITGDAMPPVGAEVRADGRKVGVLTSVVRSPSLGVIGLGVLRDPANTPDTPLEVGDDALPAVSRPLPFPEPV